MLEHNFESTELKWWNELNEEQFQDTFRMSKKTLTELQAEIDYHDNINKDRLDVRLLACLWILGNTKPFHEAEELFQIGDISSVIQTYLCNILKLGVSYIVWPSPTELKLIESGFYNNYGFPGVLGVLGSLHVEVNVDKSNNSDLYYNGIMKKHTVVMQVVCDNNYLLRDVCVGHPGGKSIKDILKESPLYSKLTDAELFTEDQHLLGGTEHPPMKTLLTPYTLIEREECTYQQNKFNVLHSSAMCAVEKAFTFLENRFPRLTRVDMFSPESASLIVNCICLLHNFTRIRNDSCELYI